MCDKCDKEVIDMGVLQSDLVGLPFKLVKFKCGYKHCNRYTRMKDYGIFPLYYRKNSKGNSWVSVMVHNYICGKHRPIYERRRKEGVEDPLFPRPVFNDEYFKAVIIPIEKSKLYKINGKANNSTSGNNSDTAKRFF